MTGSEGSSRFSTQPETAHLAVLHHGLWGSCRDLYFVEARLIENGWLVLNSTCNSERYTYDGIDVCGDRLVRETRSCCALWMSKGIRVSKVSFIGYSLGGLVVRYAIGKLHATGFFVDVRPVNVVTFASPHLGAYRQPGETATERLCNIILPWTLSRTGAQLVLGDNFLGGLPLLFVMAHPGYAFVEALHRFENRILLANIKGDTTVPYFSSAMSDRNPFEKNGGLPLSAKYPCILRTEHTNHTHLLGPSTADQPQSPTLASTQSEPSPLQPPAPSLMQSSSQLSLTDHALQSTRGPVSGLCRSESSATSRGLQQPQTLTARQIATTGSLSSQYYTSMGRAPIQDRMYTLAVRQEVPHMRYHGHPSYHTHLASSFEGYTSRPTLPRLGHHLDLYHCTASSTRGGRGPGRLNRPDRSRRKLGRLDSTSFILLLPLFLMVWLFMVALLTLWGMRHYLTRVSVGITRDRSWPVVVVQACAAAGISDASGAGRGSSGNSTGTSPRSSTNSRVHKACRRNGTLRLQQGSSSVLQIREGTSSHSSSVSDFCIASRISHNSGDMSLVEDDGSPIPSIAEEIRDMMAVCHAHVPPLDASATSLVLPDLCVESDTSQPSLRRSAQPDNSRDLQTTGTGCSHAELIADVGEDFQIRHNLHHHKIRQKQQQQQQQTSVWSPDSNVPVRTSTRVQSAAPLLMQTRNVACPAHSLLQPNCQVPSGPSSAAEYPVKLNQPTRDVISQQKSSAHDLTHAPAGEVLLESWLSQGKRLSSVSASNPPALYHRRDKLGTEQLDPGHSHLPFTKETRKQSQQIPTHVTGQDDTSEKALLHRRDSSLAVRRKLQLYSETVASECETVSQLEAVSIMSVVLATVSCIPMVEQGNNLPHHKCNGDGDSSSGSRNHNSNSSSSRDGSSSAGAKEESSSRQQSGTGSSRSSMEDACSSGDFSIECVDAETHTLILNSVVPSVDLKALRKASGCDLHKPMTHTCLAHPLGHRCRSNSRSRTRINTFQDVHVNESMRSLSSNISRPAEFNPHTQKTGANKAAVVVVTAQLESSTITVTSQPKTWRVLAGTTAMLAVLNPASLIPSFLILNKGVPDKEACSLSPAFGLSRRQWQDMMMENMNSLVWQKIHVDTHHYHAHAAIIVRSYRRFPAQEHIVEYMVQQMRL